MGVETGNTEKKNFDNDVVRAKKNIERQERKFRGSILLDTIVSSGYGLTMFIQFMNFLYQEKQLTTLDIAKDLKDLAENYKGDPGSPTGFIGNFFRELSIYIEATYVSGTLAERTLADLHWDVQNDATGLIKRFSSEVTTKLKSNKTETELDELEGNYKRGLFKEFWNRSFRNTAKKAYDFAIEDVVKLTEIFSKDEASMFLANVGTAHLRGLISNVSEIISKSWLQSLASDFTYVQAELTKQQSGDSQNLDN